jgi:hypothetical protein
MHTLPSHTPHPTASTHTIIPAFDPATLTDAQDVPDVPRGLKGRVPSFPLAELFGASRNTPINQEMIYLNLAEVDINLEMGDRRVFRHRPRVSSNSQCA